MGLIVFVTDSATAPLFGLMGAKVFEAKNSDEAIKIIKELVGNPEVSAIAVSYDVIKDRESEVKEMAKKISKPLITIIPGLKEKPPKLDPTKILLEALGFG